ncbi:hypothetical protein [Halocella sp. SP3-1]|nr:hypothetical protein [Halocella sp. SP3-1]
MKYPVLVYKRINGQEYYHGIGQTYIENKMDRNKKDSTDCSSAESTRKIS